MIASFLITLRPTHPAPLGRHLGRSLHGLLMNLVAGANPDLAERLHGDQRVKPVTVSALLGRFNREGDRVVAMPEERYTVRYTVLTDEVFAALAQILMARYLGGQLAHIDGQPFQIEGIAVDPQETDGWGGITSCQQLYEQRSQARDITLEFSSPTAFKTGDTTLLFPLTRSVFGSYRRAWDTFADMPLSSDLLDFAEQYVVTSRYHLETQVIRPEGYQLIGFTGQCTFRVLRTDMPYLGELNALADFALYCGTGMKTTQGMGQTRRVV